MAVQGREVTITDVPTAIVRGADGAGGSIVVRLRNPGRVSVRLGGGDVAASGPQAGYELPGGADIGPILLASADEAYGVVESGEAVIQVFLVGAR